jgi:hypothetical protein
MFAEILSTPTITMSKILLPAEKQYSDPDWKKGLICSCLPRQLEATARYITQNCATEPVLWYRSISMPVIHKIKTNSGFCPGLSKYNEPVRFTPGDRYNRSH